MSRFETGRLARFHQLGDQKRLHESGGQVLDLSLQQQQLWLDNIAKTVDSKEFPGAILPRLTDSNVVYYALANSENEWSKLHPILKAFAGPTILWQYRLDQSDALDQELLGHNFAVICKYSVPKKDLHLFERQKKRALQAMNNLALGVMNAPQIDKKRPHSLAEILDSFELALDAGDSQECEEIIEDLRESNLLDHMNRRFLSVRVFQRMGDWGGLYNWRSFKRICKARRPARITSILVRAIYHVKLASLGDDIEALKRKFQEVILPIAEGLFEEFPEGADEAVLRAFAVHSAVTGTRLHSNRLSAIAQTFGNQNFSNFLALCIDSEGKTESQTNAPEEELIPVSTTLQHFAQKELVKAIALAYAENCPNKATLAIELYEQLPEAEQQEVLTNGNISAMWHHLTTILSGGWDNCFETLCTSSDAESAVILHEALNSWPAQDQLSGKEHANSFLEKLESALDHETSGPKLVNQLQALVNWVEEDPEFPREDAVPIYITLIELYALSERITLQRLESYSCLLEHILSCGLNADQYERTIDATVLLVDEINANRSLDWMIDLGGIVLDQHSPSPALRETLLWNVLTKVKSLGVELTQLQQVSLRILFRALKLKDDQALLELPVVQEDSALAQGAHKSIAIYTLDENAGKRAKDVLNELCPTARVSVNSDKSSNSGLKHLAKNADIFIVVWRSAKHAATIDIKQNRPKSMPTLYPSGKGASSILRELESHFKTQ